VEEQDVFEIAPRTCQPASHIRSLRGRKRWTTRRTSFTREESPRCYNLPFLSLSPFYPSCVIRRVSFTLPIGSRRAAKPCALCGKTVRSRCVPLAVPRQVPPRRLPRKDRRKKEFHAIGEDERKR